MTRMSVTRKQSLVHREAWVIQQAAGLESRGNGRKEADMETLIMLLSFGTLFAVAIFGYVSAVVTERRRKEDQPKSTLAADGDPTSPDWRSATHA